MVSIQRVFEKHVTLNRSWKGTDHSFALEPDGFRKFVRDIDRTPKMLPLKAKKLIGKEPVFKKLGKSLTTNKIIDTNAVNNIRVNVGARMIFFLNLKLLGAAHACVHPNEVEQTVLLDYF